MKNLAGLMKQATEMQQKLQEMEERLEGLAVEGQSGAGLVRLTLSGKGELKGIAIDPKLLDPAEGETLTDLIVAAHAEARRHLQVETDAARQKLTGGLNLPPGFKLPF